MSNPSLKVLLGYDIDAASEASVMSRFEAIGSKLEGIGNRMSLFLTAPIIALGIKMKDLASSTEESLNKVNVAFGGNSKEVESWSKTTLKNVGIASGTALDMAAKFGDMGTAMGLNQDQAAKMSTGLVQLSGDLASFKNIKIDIANTALTGIFTGETESLKQLGIVMTQANLQAFALKNGISEKVEKMSQAEQTALRYAYVLNVTKNSQGDFARTAGSAANQQRTFGESLKEVGANLGTIFLPVFAKVVAVLNDAVSRFSALDQEVKKNILIGAGFVAVIGPTLSVLGVVISNLTTIGALFGAAAGTAGLFAAGLAASAYYVLTNWEKVKDFFIDLEMWFFKFNSGVAVTLQSMGLISAETASNKIAAAWKLVSRWTGEAGKSTKIFGGSVTKAYDDILKLFKDLEGKGGVKDLSKGAKGAKIEVDNLSDALGKLDDKLSLKNSKEYLDNISKIKASKIGGFSFDTITPDKSRSNTLVNIGEQLRKSFDTTTLGVTLDKSTETLTGKLAIMTAKIGEGIKSMGIQTSDTWMIISGALSENFTIATSWLGDVLSTGLASVFNKSIKFDFKTMLGNLLSALGDMFIRLAAASLAGLTLANFMLGGTLSPQLASGLKLMALGVGLKAGGMAMSASAVSSTSPSASGNYNGSWGGGASTPFYKELQNVKFEIEGTKLVGVINNTNRSFNG